MLPKSFGKTGKEKTIQFYKRRNLELETSLAISLRVGKPSLCFQKAIFGALKGMLQLSKDNEVWLPNWCCYRCSALRQEKLNPARQTSVQVVYTCVCACMCVCSACLHVCACMCAASRSSRQFLHKNHLWWWEGRDNQFEVCKTAIPINVVSSFLLGLMLSTTLTKAT